MNTRRRAPFLAWLIEFSKKVVVLCVVLYAAVVLYSATAMWAAGDLSALSQKIKKSSGCKSDDESEE